MEDEHEEEEEKEEEEEEGEEVDIGSQSNGSGSNKTLLLVYRIMYYPTFDWYAFPSQTKSTLVGAASRQTISDQVNTTLQARYMVVSITGLVLSPVTFQLSLFPVFHPFSAVTVS